VPTNKQESVSIQNGNLKATALHFIL